LTQSGQVTSNRRSCRPTTHPKGRTVSDLNPSLATDDQTLTPDWRDDQSERIKAEAAQVDEPLRRVAIGLTVAVPANWTNGLVVERVTVALRPTIKVVDAEPIPDQTETIIDNPLMAALRGLDGLEAFEVLEIRDSTSLYNNIAAVARAALENDCQEHPATLIRDLRRAFLGESDGGE